MRIVEQSEEMVIVQDMDANQTIRIGKQEVVSVDDEDGAMRREVESYVILSDRKIMAAVNEIGPQCEIGQCHTRLASNHRTCHRCERPICQRHSKRFKGAYYCRSCRRIEILKALFWWFVSLFRFRQRRRGHE